MTRVLRHILIAAALLVAQHAAHLHALSHFRQDLTQCDGKCAPPPVQSTAQCFAFHAVGSALPTVRLAIEAQQTTLPALASVPLPLPFAPRIEFDSRAPPVLS